MEKIETSQFDIDTLKFLFQEVDKKSEYLISSIKELRNKSFLLIAILSSITSFSFFKLLESDISYLVMIAGGVITIMILFKNLYTFDIASRGSNTDDLVVEYFNAFDGEDKLKEYYAAQLESYQMNNYENLNLLVKIGNRYKTGLISIVLTLSFFGGLSLIRIITAIN